MTGRLLAACLLATCLLTTCLLTGCGDARSGPDDALEHLDLLGLPPLVQAIGPSIDSSTDRSIEVAVDPATSTTGVYLLGHGLVGRGDHDTPRVGAQVRTREVDADRRLIWRLELGDDPRVRVRPLASAACTLRYAVTVRGRDQPTELAARTVPRETRTSWFAPAAFDLDMGAWAGSTVELWLDSVRVDSVRVDSVRVDSGAAEPQPPSTCRARWGEPTVVHRAPAPAPPGTAERPNVVLLGLDTTRADHLGAWGRSPSVTPALDALAAESDVWTAAFAPFNVTNPSFASLFSGLYGKNHGVYDLRTPLPADRPHLAESFRDAGWRTLAVVSATHLGPDQSGLGRGFQRFETPWGQYAAETVVQTAIDWIERADGRFFAFLHLFDPHTPHTPPSPFVESARDEPFVDPILGGAHDLYLGELAYLDRQIGRLLESLASRGLLETTIVAVVADHGENFGEQGVHFRHAGLWDATLHVPLLIRPPAPPGRVGRRFDALVQTLDLAPTLLHLAGLESLEGEGDAIDGRDLYELSIERSGRRAVFAESSDRRGAMVRTREHLYTRLDDPLVDGSLFLFDLRDDPAQTRNLAGTGAAIEDELAGLLDRWLADRRAGTVPEAVDLPAEELERLRALGYLD